MRVLAIDPGTKCGWAVMEGGRAATRVTESGVWSLKPRRGESQGFRYLRLIGLIESALERNADLDAVAYEQAHQRGGAATEYALGCATHIQSWCAQNNIQHVAVHSATIKSFAVGRAPRRKKGQPRFDRSKGAVIAACRSRFPDIEIIDDNHADALMLCAYTIDQLMGGK